LSGQKVKRKRGLNKNPRKQQLFVSLAIRTMLGCSKSLY